MSTGSKNQYEFTDAELGVRNCERREQPAGHHGGQDGLPGGQAHQHTGLPRAPPGPTLQVHKWAENQFHAQQIYVINGAPSTAVQCTLPAVGHGTNELSREIGWPILHFYFKANGYKIL